MKRQPKKIKKQVRPKEYELYKSECNGKPLKVSSDGNFGKLPVGRYCVRAGYLGGKTYYWSDGIQFVVEMKKKVIITPKKKIVPSKKVVTH